MKRIAHLSLTLTLFSVFVLQGFAQACSSVETLNTTQAPSTVVLTLQANSTQADMQTFQLAGGATHLNTMNLGPRSDSSLMLLASVSEGTGSATCQIPVSGCLNMALTISSSGQICTPPPPVDEDCQHDNGNHWGEYRQLGQNPPPHSGKPGETKPCKSNKSSGTPPPSGVPVCKTQLTCSFTQHE